MVSKDELLDAVWPGVVVVEGSLATAISKLRRAMGEEAPLIETVPRIGYRLAATVTAREVHPASPALAITPGAVVPGRPNWRFAERLGGGAGREVWRIGQVSTGEMRVLKLAADPGQLRALRRESVIARLLAHALGPARPDLVAVLDWNFTAPPFWLESGFGGPDLIRWAAVQGGLDAVAPAVRIGLVASIAETVAAAHGAGVLHRDLKPANILIDAGAEGGWQARVIDFGSAGVARAELLAGLELTGGDPAEDDGGPPPGTAMWMAPEELAGGAEAAGSTRADVYALGVMLYQMVVGDLRRPLAAGWEAGVGDPLLREDIAQAAAGDPDRRLDSAAELARRLRTLQARRQERDALDEARARARAAEARIEAARVRRPWVMAAVATLLAGGLVALLLWVRAARDRDEARRQTAISEMVRHFLADDLLARSNPFRAGSADESLADAVRRVSPQIDRRFGDAPAVAARLHQTIANALDQRNDWEGARGAYGRAAALWESVPGGTSDAVVTRLQAAMMEARSSLVGSLPRAVTMIGAAEAQIAAQRLTRPDLSVWLASAKGMAALIGNDVRTAEAAFGRAVALADGLADFAPLARLTLRQRLAFTRIRLGEGAAAEALFRDLAVRYAAIEGPDGPDVLMVRMNLAQALMVQGRHADAIAQADLVYPGLRARLGEDHEMTLQVLTTRAQSEGVLERWDDAIRDDLHVHDVAVRRQGPGSFFAIATLSDAATAQCRAGRLADGTAHASEAHAAAVAGFARSALADATGFTLAECEIAAGRYDTAAEHLRGIDRAAVAQLAGDPHWGANVDLALARIAAAQGRTDEARRRLEASRVAFTAPTAEPYQVRLWRALDRTLP